MDAAGQWRLADGVARLAVVVGQDWSSISMRGAMGVAVGAGVRVGVGSGVRVTVAKARVGRSAVGSAPSRSEHPATVSTNTRASKVSNRGFDKVSTSTPLGRKVEL